MKKQILVGMATLALTAAAVLAWHSRDKADSDTLVLHGNVDLRQISLAFDGSERIAALHVEEGDRVAAGQILATLDTRTLRLQIEQARATLRAREQAWRRLQNGSRPQEIAQAQARVEAATAETTFAAQDVARLRAIARDSDGYALSRQEREQAQTRLRVTRAQARDAAKALELAQLGPRAEEIAQADALMQATAAELALLQHRLSQSELRAPTAAVVRSRLREAGDMASPQQPVFALALNQYKWIRAYVSERQLGRVRPGMPAWIVTDSDPGKRIAGVVGYISSVAEFTPKSVQTEELRTSLVYEIRVRLHDSDDRLRLGMPATVSLVLNSAATERR